MVKNAINLLSVASAGSALHYELTCGYRLPYNCLIGWEILFIYSNKERKRLKKSRTSQSLIPIKTQMSSIGKIFHRISFAGRCLFHVCSCATWKDTFQSASGLTSRRNNGEKHKSCEEEARRGRLRIERRRSEGNGPAGPIRTRRTAFHAAQHMLSRGCIPREEHLHIRGLPLIRQIPQSGFILPAADAGLAAAKSPAGFFRRAGEVAEK